MKKPIIRSVIDNTFLPIILIKKRGRIKKLLYYDKKLLYYDKNNENKIDGGFALNFCGIKEEKLFEQHLKTQPEDWYYRTHPVKYTLNSLGYRTKEFDDIDWKESIVMFGGSYVFGKGVTDQHTIPYFLEQLSGRPVINMGINAASVQTVLHNSIIFTDSKYPTPKAVVYIIPSLDNRYHLYETNSIDIGHIRDLNSSDNQFEKKENSLSFSLMNIKMIRNLWKNKTIYYEGTFFIWHQKLINKLDKEIYCEFFEHDGGLARDLDHNGPVKNLEIAKCIHKKLKLQLKN